MNAYIKTIVALLGAISTWGVTASDGGFSIGEWFGLLGAIATGFAVYALPNSAPPAPPGEDGEAGHAESGLLILVLILVGVLLLLFGVS